MRQIAALVLAQALVVSTGMGPALHVHGYVGHDHRDHHHGPASHEHHDAALAAEDHHAEAVNTSAPAIHAESCDPGRHSITVTMACAHVPHGHVVVAELPGPAVLAPAPLERTPVSINDVRVHGPPADLRIPSRAPPLTLHA